MLVKAEMFEDYKSKIGRLKKVQYEENMKHFREKYGQRLEEMLAEVEAADDKENAAKTIGQQMAAAVYEAYSSKGRFLGQRMKGIVLTDLNIYMIYYIFPAILLTDHEQAVCLCDNLRDSWNQYFKADIEYTDYRTMYNNFPEKILGIM